MQYKKGQVFFNEKYNSYYYIEAIIVDSKDNTWCKCYYPELDKWGTYSPLKMKHEHKYISDKAEELLKVLYHTTA